MRIFFLNIFKFLNPGDISIHHHHTKQKLTLHSFRHRGYWYIGALREAGLIAITKKYLEPGMTVVEVGGHIGYLTMLYADAVGRNGSVKVFEPGRDNRKYLTKNCGQLENVEIFSEAVSSEDGYADFFEEDLSGQNNSLMSEQTALQSVKATSKISVNVSKTSVKTIALANFLVARRLQPDFIKIDVEGGELLVLKGLRDFLSRGDMSKPVLMIEFDKTCASQCVALLEECGYSVFDQAGQIFECDNIGLLAYGFCIHKTSAEKIRSRIFEN